MQKAASVLLPNTRSFPRAERLRSEKDFKSAYAGKRLSGKYVIVYYEICAATTRKAGFTVSRKVSGLAVVRNRLKRRLREIYRCNKQLLPTGVNVVIRSLPQATTGGFDELQNELIGIFTKISSAQHSNRAY